MKFILTKEMLSKMIRNNESDYWHDAMKAKLPDYGITKEKRLAAFIAQCAVESGDFKHLEENLNYSVASLNRVFGKYFRDRNPADYARNPEKLANYVYMDKFRTKRGALGNVEEGDGWRFRGRGLKQLTGRANYEAFAKDIGMTAEEAAAYCETKEGALESACWFWKRANGNWYADRWEIESLSKRINGGTNGLKQRLSKSDEFLRILKSEVGVEEDIAKAPDVPIEKEIVDEESESEFRIIDQVIEYFSGSEKNKSEPPKSKNDTNLQEPEKTKVNVTTNPTLRIGSRGKYVRLLQEKLGLDVDGIFGPNTHRAVKRYQQENGLIRDGIVGISTWEDLTNG